MFSCAKEEVAGDPNYPTIINPLPSDKLDQLLIDLSETQLYQCTSIDTFGYCYVTLKNDECGHFDTTYIDYSRDDLTAIFYESIVKYGKFINVTDTTGIKISSIRNNKNLVFSDTVTTYPDSTEGWIITSNLQFLNGYEIPGTEIKVEIFFDMVRSIEGRRFNELYLPVSDIYTEKMAEESLIGKEYTFSSTTIKINAETYWNNSEKIILPVTKSSVIQLRVCWALHPANWIIIVDSQTGEVLSWVNMDKV